MYDGSMAKPAPSPFVNGVPELLILRLLSRKEMYGYELIKAVRILTGAHLELGEGVVYPTLHALEENGFLRSRTTEANGRSRYYYRTTAKGKRRLHSIMAEWDRVTTAVESVLGEDEVPHGA